MLTTLVIFYIKYIRSRKSIIHFLVATVIKDGRYGVGNTEPFLTNTYCSQMYTNLRYCNTWQSSQCSNKCFNNRIGIKCYGKNYILYTNVFILVKL